MCVLYAQDTALGSLSFLSFPRFFLELLSQPVIPRLLCASIKKMNTNEEALFALLFMLISLCGLNSKNAFCNHLGPQVPFSKWLSHFSLYRTVFLFFLLNLIVASKLLNNM